MRNLDFHFHCNSSLASDLENTLAACKKMNTVVTMIGGLRYGGHDMVPNEEVLEICKRHSDWFVPVAKFDLWDKVDVDLIYRWKEAGFKAIKFIYPYYEYDHDLYLPVYEACQACDLPVLFHTGDYRPNEADVRWQRPILKNMQPINLDRICRCFPKLHVVMAHMGTTFFREMAAELIKMLPNLYFDLAGNGAWMRVSPEYLKQLLLPSPLCFGGYDIYKYFRKMVFGSDGYTKNQEALLNGQGYYERLLIHNGVPEDVYRGVMGGTVAGWMGLDL